MGEQYINRHLYRARKRLENIPRRAVEQDWETHDPLVGETLTVIAHALIAQAEIGQETLWELRRLNQRVNDIKVTGIRQYYEVPYAAIDRYSKDAAQKHAKEYVEEMVTHKQGWIDELIRIFGGKDG